MHLERHQIREHQNAAIVGEPGEMRNISECGFWEFDCVTDPARFPI